MRPVGVGLMSRGPIGVEDIHYDQGQFVLIGYPLNHLFRHELYRL